MQRAKHQRRSYLVDPAQVAIVNQTVRHWLYCFAIYTTIVFVCRIAPFWFSGEANLGIVWYHLAPMAISSVVLLPILILSSIRFSHRFVGPMVRFRKVLKQLASGQTAAPVGLRRNDYWHDCAKLIDEVSVRLSESEASKHAVAGDPVTTNSN